MSLKGWWTALPDYAEVTLRRFVTSQTVSKRKSILNFDTILLTYRYVTGLQNKVPTSNTIGINVLIIFAKYIRTNILSFQENRLSLTIDFVWTYFDCITSITGKLFWKFYLMILKIQIIKPEQLSIAVSGKFNLIIHLII